MELHLAHKNTLLIHLGFLQHFVNGSYFVCKLINTLELASLFQDQGRTAWKLISSSKISGGESYMNRRTLFSTYCAV